MDYLLSVLYIGLENFVFILFMDAFAVRRWRGGKFWQNAALLFVCNYFLLFLLALSPGVPHTAIGLASFAVEALILYENRSPLYLLLLSLLSYLIIYFCSFIGVAVGATVLQISLSDLAATYVPSIICALLSRLFMILIAAAVKKFRTGKAASNLKWPYLLLTFLFPSSTLLTLIVFLLLIISNPQWNNFIIWCSISLLISTIAVLVILNWLEQSSAEREKALALAQKLQLQTENVEALSAAYANQRKASHDFGAHLDTLSNLLTEGKIEEATAYLQTICRQHNTRTLLVNTHHAAVDALLNQKAYAAQQHGIQIHFEVNDLSALPFEQTDIIVILANLLDNSIEACAQCERKRIEVQIFLGNTFFFSICNTSNPVKIIGDSISSTKSDPALHGFGLANVKTLLEKYHGDHVMLYRDGWFQFTGEIMVVPVS